MPRLNSLGTRERGSHDEQRCARVHAKVKGQPTVEDGIQAGRAQFLSSLSFESATAQRGDQQWPRHGEWAGGRLPVSAMPSNEALLIKSNRGASA